MQNDKMAINERFIELSKLLVFQKIVKNDKDFALKLGIHPQSFADIKYMRRGVTVDMIRDLRINFNVNPNWIIFGSGDMYITDKNVEKSDLNVKGNVKPNAILVSKPLPNEQKSPPIPSHYVQNQTPQNSTVSEPQHAYAHTSIIEQSLQVEINSLRQVIQALQEQIEALKEVKELQKNIIDRQKNNK